jgi:hypothetical protein
MEGIGRVGGTLAGYRALGWLLPDSEPWNGQVPTKTVATGTSSQVVSGYGLDPNLITPSTPWPYILSEEQKNYLAALSDILLPPIEGMPAPSQMGVVKFLDEWLSAPYDQQQRDQVLILSGLTELDIDSQAKYGQNFLDLTSDRRRLILDGFAADTDDNSTGRRFFMRMRYLVIGGYYTSDMGLRAIGYRGNVPLQNYGSLSSEIYEGINAELARLNLPPQGPSKSE